MNECLWYPCESCNSMNIAYEEDAKDPKKILCLCKDCGDEWIDYDE